jgi:hypothetical protein
LGKMKGRYTQVLTDFWTGRLKVSDTLNTGIRLLAPNEFSGSNG